MLVVKLPGPRLDAVRAPAFKDSLTQNVRNRPDRVLIDATEVDFIDSSGLGALVFLLKLMGDGGRVAVTGANPSVRRLFEITKLDGVFGLADTSAAAAARLGA